jgi:hypothetical protein
MSGTHKIKIKEEKVEEIEQAKAELKAFLEKKPEPKDEEVTTKTVVKTEEVKEKKIFSCNDCGLNEEYDFFGKNPPFCRSIVFHENSYVCRDPFSAFSSGNSSNFLLLGSNCSLCKAMTCQDCSIFYTKRLCKKCTTSTSTLLPQQLLKNKEVPKD